MRAPPADNLAILAKRVANSRNGTNFVLLLILSAG
jgi:hypothetical protein